MSRVHPNPIHKRIAGHGLLSDGSSRPLYRWSATCPDCEKEVTRGVGYAGGISTRKQAKDALYLHRKRRGGIFGCSGSSPALVEE